MLWTSPKAVRSRSDNGVLIATALEDAQRTASFIVKLSNGETSTVVSDFIILGGVFLTRTYTRLPGQEED